MFSADDVLAVLHDTKGRDVEARFRRFVRGTHATAWHGAADFVTSDGSCARDAFTVFPNDNELAAILQEIRDTGAKDLKEVRQVGEPMLRYLRDPRRFHFCFLLDSERHELMPKAQLIELIDGTLDLLRSLKNAEAWRRHLDALKRLRQRATRNSLDPKLMANLFMAACFAGLIASLIARHGRADSIGWYPDRDAMVTTHCGIIHNLYELNFSAMCRRHGVDPHLTQLQIGAPAPRSIGPIGLIGRTARRRRARRALWVLSAR